MFVCSSLILSNARSLESDREVPRIGSSLTPSMPPLSPRGSLRVLLHSSLSPMSLRPYVTRSVPELLIISIYIVCVVVRYRSENHGQVPAHGFMAPLSSLPIPWLVPRSSLSSSYGSSATRSATARVRR